MSDNRLKELHERSNFGSVTEAAIAEVILASNEQASSSDKLMTVEILCNVDAPKYQAEIEKYLLEPTDWFIGWYALNVLVARCGLTSPAIVHAIEQMLTGVHWDESEQLRTLAIRTGATLPDSGDTQTIHTWIQSAAQLERADWDSSKLGRRPENEAEINDLCEEAKVAFLRNDHS